MLGAHRTLVVDSINFGPRILQGGNTHLALGSSENGGEFTAVELSTGGSAGDALVCVRATCAPGVEATHTPSIKAVVKAYEQCLIAQGTRCDSLGKVIGLEQLWRMPDKMELLVTFPNGSRRRLVNENGFVKVHDATKKHTMLRSFAELGKVLAA